MNDEAPIDLQQLRATLPKVAAAWVLQLQLELVQARAGEVSMRMPVSAPLVHGGGVLCGQALMAAADTAMILAITTQLGEFKPMTTVQLQTSFLRPVPGNSAHVMVVARVLRMGRKLVFGEIHLSAEDGTLAAHATTTYALL
ncbi:MAG: PaaI family thioesterase [Rubrivivax sp.]